MTDMEREAEVDFRLQSDLGVAGKVCFQETAKPISTAKMGALRTGSFGAVYRTFRFQVIAVRPLQM